MRAFQQQDNFTNTSCTHLNTQGVFDDVNSAIHRYFGVRYRWISMVTSSVGLACAIYYKNSINPILAVMMIESSGHLQGTVNHILHIKKDLQNKMRHLQRVMDMMKIPQEKEDQPSISEALKAPATVAENGDEAVSYTHLTLPTILLV